MIIMQDVLDSDIFRNAKVLAGEKGLLREVRTITIAEVPDSANWLRGGELVCTTAFFISDRNFQQIDWIKSIILNGASALAIKTTRFLGELPKNIIDYADENDFLIIELDHQITWPTVIESFMDFVMNERMKVMKLVEEIQTDLINLVLDNNTTIQSIVDRISIIFGNAIILEDAKLNVIAVSRSENQEEHDNDAIINERLKESFKHQIMNSKFYKNIKNGVKAEHLECSITGKEFDLAKNIMIPIYSNKSIYGFISLLETQTKYSSRDLLILKTSSTAIALQLMKQYLNQETFRKKNLALIEDIIHGRIHTQFIFEYDYQNINLTNPMITILLNFSELNFENSYFWDRSEDLITMTIKQKLNKHFNQVIIGNNGSSFTILVSFHPNKINEVTKFIKMDMEKALNELTKKFGENKFRVGVGEAYPKLEMVGKSFKEANTALSVVKKFAGKKGNLLLFEDIGIHRILNMIQNSEEILDFCDDFLNDLKEIDSENVLLKTLHEYLLSDCSIKETAKKMFIHPNTVSYRFKKIKQTIKHDINLPEFKMAYLFALESNELLK